MRAVVKRVAIVAILLGASQTPVFAGHEVTFYPSYYPDEIRIDTLKPAAAAALLADKKLHAFLGEIPGGAERLPDHVKLVESLESFVVLDFNPASRAFASGGSRCAAARGIRAALRTGGPNFVFHPYPVTPYHADFLHHLDLIEESRAAPDSVDPAATSLKVRAKGRHAETIVRSRWGTGSGEWDVSLEEVRVYDFGADADTRLNGWLGPPWAKEGWFQAYRLLAPAIADAESRQEADSIQDQLLHGIYLNLAERMELERNLIAALTRGCDRAVVGYTVRREFYNDDYADGVENVGYDSQMGLNTPVFVRTVKLKDYPWNGKLRVGINGEAEAAWNPVAGFTDAAGRLIWSTIGDPALLPVPYNASWAPNRVEFELDRVQGQSGGFKVLAGSVLPRPGTGALLAVPEGTHGSAKLVYQAFASPYQDGTETGVADLMYAFVLAYRWAERANPGDPAYEPRVAAATTDLRDRLAGIRIDRVEQSVNRIAPGIEVIKKTPVLEIYLGDTLGDPRQVAALAPPWSTIPWHLMVLMEEAVVRGHAAFSRDEASRRNVPWLDLVRDAAQHETLRGLIGAFETAGYRPASLRDLVSEDEARARWRALREFAEKNGHFLVTNGPYRLKQWRSGPVVLKAVREVTYPLGFGTFDRYVHPLRALVREVTREAGRITVRIDVEKTVKAGRRYKVEVAPLSRTTARGIYGALVESRYLLIGPDGTVVQADNMRWLGDERFVVELPEEMSPGRYTFLAAVYLDGNSLTPSTGMLRFEAKG